MRQQLEQLILGPLYALAIGLRKGLWAARWPMLVGVRALIVRRAAGRATEVLLVRHRSGRRPWAMPGGGVRRYERMGEAARREAWEETGATVRIEGLLGLYENFEGGMSNYIAVFVCAPLEEPRPVRSFEIAEVRYFALDSLPTGLDAASRRRIEEFRAGEQGISRLW